MNTTNNKNYITVIKSVGYSADTGEVLDDSQGLMELVEFVEDEDTSAEVTFEEGLKELKEYMLNANAEEEDINKVEKLEISDYLIELGNIETELFDYQCKNF